MKLYYLDSSALVKGYVKEKGSEKVREIQIVLYIVK